MADIATNIFEKFAASREVKPPAPPKKAKRTLGNPMVMAEAQAVYQAPMQGAPGPGPGGTTQAMGTSGAWGTPEGRK